MESEDTKKDTKTIWYRMVCKHCDIDGYIYSSYKLPLDSCNIDNPNSTERTPFEVLPHDREGWVRIKCKCNQCHGLKYYLYNSDAWEMEVKRVDEGG